MTSNVGASKISKQKNLGFSTSKDNEDDIEESIMKKWKII